MSVDRWMPGDYPASWDLIAMEALRQAVNLRCAGTVIVRSYPEPAIETVRSSADHVRLGTVGIIVTETERAQLAGRQLSKMLVDRLLATVNPCAVGM